ncbi:PAS domain S-box protein [Telluribacter sp. SYSU D00476]|uniref:PAS domain S-box protein n=1 Tax=Telluribacter sp. SYSU D00476 TaxID=2811430 RepID=UPI001FF626CE|nr:PAS domain S-box protein [Telluribacter sp. SYSU D00476]
MLRIPLRISLIYFIVGTTWIVTTDLLLHFVFQIDRGLTVAIAKGLLFVTVSSLLLYLLSRRNYRQLSQSEKQYRALFENNPSPTWIYKLSDLRFLAVNDAAVQKYGYSQEEFLSMTCLELRPPEEMERFLNFVGTYQQEYMSAGTWRHLLKNGQTIYTTINTYPVDFDGEEAALVIAQDITKQIEKEREAEQKNQELEKLNEKLLEKRERLRYVQKLAKVAGWEYYPDEDQLVGADEILSLFSHEDQGALTYAELFEAIVPEDLPRVLRANKQLLRTGQKTEVSYRIRWEEQIRYLRQVGEADLLDGERILRGMVQDVTAMKKMEDERDQVGSTLRRTLDSITDGVIELDRTWRVTRINKAFERLLDIEAGNVVGLAVLDVFPDAVSLRSYPEYTNAMEKGSVSRFEEYYAGRDKWFFVTVIPTQEGIAAYFQDITERKKHEEQARIWLHRYESVAKATREAIFDFDLTTMILVWNQGLERIYGYGPEYHETPLSWWEERVHPDDRHRASKSLNEGISNGSTFWSEQYRFRCANGVYKYVEDSGHIIFDSNQEAVRMIGSLRDIDDLTRANAENKRLAEIITKVNNVVVITDVEGRINYINPRFTEVTGYTFEEVAGRKPGEVLQGPESDLEVVRHMGESLRERQYFSVEIINYTKDGRKYWMHVDCTPIYDDFGNHQGFIAIQNEVTERKEKEVLLQEHVRVLKEISWLNSHEIRRPVTEIMGLMYLIKDTDCDEEKNELYGLVNEAAHNLDRIVREVAVKAYSLYGEKGFS